MASNPQLPNHLIRELMHTILLKRNDNGLINGDAMVLLALSGKGTFPIFRYVVETHVFAFTSLSGVSLQSVLPNKAYNNITPCRRDRMLLTKEPDPENHMPHVAAMCEKNIWQDRLDVIKFQSDGIERLVIRFVRKLRAYCIPSNPSLFENVVALTIDKFDKSFTPTLNSLSDLEVLKLDFSYCNFDGFFNEVSNGNISLTNLRRLDMRLDFDDFLKVMSTSTFPLPEDVTFKFDLDVMPDLNSLQTFPNVKHLEINIKVYVPMTSAVLHLFSTIINRFTGLETAKLDVYYVHSWRKNEFARVVEFHEWLHNTNFSFSFEVDYHELGRLYYVEKPKSIYGQLKSIGYEDYGEPNEIFYIFKKEYGNVKFTHQIKFFDHNRSRTPDDLRSCRGRFH